LSSAVLLMEEGARKLRRRRCTNLYVGRGQCSHEMFLGWAHLKIHVAKSTISYGKLTAPYDFCSHINCFLGKSIPEKRKA